MKSIHKFYSSSIGKKFIVAVTGFFLFGFVIAHMLGNLKTFLGVDPVSGVHKLDLYARFLRTMGSSVFVESGVLWIMRVALLLAVVLHVVTVIQLWKMNKAAHPQEYAVRRYRSVTLASRLMYWGGFVLAAFIIYHILHMTTGHLHFEGFVEGQVYANVYKGFQLWYVTLFYVLAMAALFLHLKHGAWSLFQTLGLDQPRRNPMLRSFANAASVILFLGFISVPLAVFFGLLPEPPVNVSNHF